MLLRSSAVFILSRGLPDVSDKPQSAVAQPALTYVLLLSPGVADSIRSPSVSLISSATSFGVPGLTFFPTPTAHAAFPAPTPGTLFHFLGVSLPPFSLIPQIGSTRKSSAVHSPNTAILLFLSISLLVLGPVLSPIPSRNCRVSSGPPDWLLGEESASLSWRAFCSCRQRQAPPNQESEKCAALCVGRAFGRNPGAHPLGNR